MHLLRDVSAYQVMLPELLLNSAKMCPCNTEPLCVVVRCMYTSPCLRGCLMVMRARVTCHARPCDISCAPAPATHPSQGFMDILRDMTAASGTLHVIEGSTGCSVAVVNEWYVPRRWRVGGGGAEGPRNARKSALQSFPRATGLLFYPVFLQPPFLLLSYAVEEFLRCFSNLIRWGFSVFLHTSVYGLPPFSSCPIKKMSCPRICQGKTVRVCGLQPLCAELVFALSHFGQCDARRLVVLCISHLIFSSTLHRPIPRREMPRSSDPSSQAEGGG